MDEGREILMCVDAGMLPLIKKILYIVFVDNRPALKYDRKLARLLLIGIDHCSGLSRDSSLTNSSACFVSNYDIYCCRSIQSNRLFFRRSVKKFLNL
jgi:hypothetical protein